MIHPALRYLFPILLASSFLHPLLGATRTYHKDGRNTTKLLIPDSPKSSDLPGEVTSREFLQDHQVDFGLTPEHSPLELVSTRESLLGTHYRYRQLLNDLPVLGSEVVVSIRHKNGQVYQAFNNSYPVTQSPPLAKNLMDQEQALDVAWQHLEVRGKLHSLPASRLVYLPQNGQFTLAFEIEIACADPLGDWQVLVDARTEKIISSKDRHLYKNGHKSPQKSHPKNTPILSRAEATEQWVDLSQIQSASKSVAKTTVDGTALVFDPDPRTHLANDALLDSSPASEFSSAYVTRTLRDITEDGGVYSLSGPWVVIADFDAPTAAPSTTTDGNWTALRGNNAFNDAMTYFHIDQNQRYLQSLGFSGARGIQDAPISVDTHGANGDDNSFYFPSGNTLRFGHGGVDDNEDADVILHEYGHAITYDIVPTWGGGDTGAIGEGFGDYWGASYSYTTPNGPTYHPEWAFSWDGHGSDTWAGRRLDYTSLTYDPGITYTDHMLIDGITNYSDQLWGTPLFQAFLALVNQGVPRTEVDQIVIESFFGIGGNPTMRELATATVNAASLLFPSGPHASVFFQKFTDQNIIHLDPGTFTAQANGSTQIDLAWTQNPAATETLIAWNTRDLFGAPTGPLVAGELIPGGGVVLYRGTADTLAHSNLPVGKYYYRAWSRQSDGSYSNGITTSASVGTSITTLFSEGFENGGSQPSGWTQELVSGTTNWTYQNGGANSHPSSAHGGSYNAFLFASDVSNDQNKLVSPAIDLSHVSGSVTLEFWHHMENWEGDQDELRVYYKTSAGGSWNLLETFISNVSPWTLQSLSLPNPSATYYLAFEGNAKWGYGVCLDDIKVTSFVTPPALVITANTTTIGEETGSPAGAFTITRNSAYSSTRTVNLNSNDPSELTLPASVQISADQSSAIVSFDTIDDAIDDGTQLVTVTASSSGFLSATQEFQIEDDEDSYLDWTSRNGLNGASADEAASPHGDGIANLTKFAFNMNGQAPDVTSLLPGTGLTGLPVYHENGSGSGHFDFIRQTGSLISYTLESSQNSLAPWSPVTITPAMITPIDPYWERVSVPISDSPSVTGHFFRVKLSLPVGP